MKFDRTRNARTNIVFGILYKIYIIVLPFIMRTTMIYQMGIEYVGLNNLFTSIFQVLNLAELGIGAALTCSMYKPIAEDNDEEICALLKLYRKCFNIIGCIILILGLCCIPFLDKLINGDIPGNLNMTILFLMYLTNTILSYWLFSYKKSLLYAHQRNDILSKVMLFTYTIQFGIQIYILYFLKNYYYYLVISIIAQILQNIICSVIIDRMYPKYKPQGNLDKDILNDIKKKTEGLITNKIGNTILRSVDSIVISAFLGLSVLGIYQNYYFILTAIIGIFGIIYESCLAGIGNSLIIENSNKNYDDFRTITNIVGWLICICCCCFIVLYQPFMTFWVGKEYLLDFKLVICFIIYFFLFEIDQLISMYKDAAGIWYIDRYRPLVAAMINLAMNLMLVKIIGLYGILLSTIIVFMIIDIPWLIHNVFKTLFYENSVKSFISILIKISCYSICIPFIAYLICSFISDDGILSLFIKFLIATITSCLFLYIFERKTKNFAYLRIQVFSRLKKNK